MADIVINPAIGKIDFFSVKGDNVTNTLKLTGNTLLVTGPLSASSISTGGGGVFVTSVQPTSNYLSKFTGNSTIANSLIYDNGTNVGIGTTTSAARLQINSTTSGATLLRTDGTSGTLFTVVDDLSDSLMSVNNSAGLPVLEVFADDRIVGGQYGTNDFVVINNKVGIGTNNPTAKLQVTSSVSTPSAAFLGGNVGIGTTSPAVKLDVAGTIRSSTNEIYGFGASDNVSLRAASTSNVLGIYTSNTERLRVTADGNVGIGSSSPKQKLDIAGAGAGSIALTNTGTSGYSEIIFYEGSSVKGDIWVNGSAQSNYAGVNSLNILQNSNAPIAFYTNGNNERIRIAADGNVGIGISNVTRKLIVNGDSAFAVNSGGLVIASYDGDTANIRPSVANGSVLISDDSNLLTRGTEFLNGGGMIVQSISGFTPLQVKSDGNTLLFVASGGNVGIGTSSPGAKLDVSGNLIASSTITATNTIYIQKGVGGYQSYITAEQTAANTGNSFKFWNSGTSMLMTIGYDGNVGIGTSTLFAKLVVSNGSGENIEFTPGNATVNGGLIENINRSTGTTRPDLNLFTSNASNGSIKFYTNGVNERMRVTGAGNVGIGTSSPTAKLQVGTQMYGSAPDANYFVVGNENFTGPGPIGGITGYPVTANRNQVTASIFDVVGGWERGNGSHALLRVSAYDVINSAPALTVLNNGNVGMGTTTPISLLDVRSGYITAGSSASTNGSTILAGYYSNSAGVLTVLGTEQSSGGPVLGYAVTPSTSATGAFLSSTTITIPRSAYTQDGGTHRWYTGASQTVAIGSAVSTSERMRMDINGNIGIGTSTPRQILHLNGSILLDGLQNGYEQGSTRAIGYGSNSGAVNTDGFSGMDIQSVNAPAPNGGNYSQNVRFWTHHYGTGTGNTPRMVLQYNGNVGIGTTVPTYKLDVNGTFNATGTSTLAGVSITGTINSSATETIRINNNNGYISIYNSAGTTRTGYIQGLTGSSLTLSAENSAVLRFLVDGSERARIDTNGNVGIGITVPAAKLHCYNGSSGGQVSSNSNLIAIESNGNNGLQFLNPNANNANINFGDQADNEIGFIQYQHATDAMRFRAGGTTIMSLVSGNVGIGISSPTSKLHVVETTATGSRIQLGSASTNALMNTNLVNDFLILTAPFNAVPASTSNNNAKWGIKMGGGSTDAPNISGKSACIYAVSEEDIGAGGSGAGYNRKVGLALHTSPFDLPNVERVRITNGGYVGIGTSTTTSGLQIQTEGTNTASGSFLFVRSTNASFGGGAIGVGYQYAAAVGNNYTPFRIRGGSTNAIFTINSSGTVYAGDTTGAVAYGNHDPYYTFNQDTNTGMDWAAADTLTFKTGGTERLRISSAGNIGIGTTIPTGKLQLGADYANDGYGGYDIYVKSTTAGTLSSYDPRVQNTSIFSLLITDSSSTTTGPDKIGLVLHNNNATAGAFSPMLLFTKKESGSTPYKATMAGIYARSPLGTGNADSWIDGELIFATAGAASEGIKQRMVIDKEGNVGIGTNAPISKLNAYASGSNLSVLKVDGGNGTLFEVTDQLSGSLFSVNTIAGLPVMEAFSNNRVVMGTYGTNALVVSGSNVGIGTSTPAAKLEVVASSGTTYQAIFQSPSGANAGYLGGIQLGNGASSQNSQIYHNSSGDNTLTFVSNYSGGTANKFIFSPGGTERVRFQQNGNVGIGTTSPIAKLETYGGSMDPTLTPGDPSIFSVNSLGVQLAVGRMVTTPFSIWFQGKHATVGGGLTYPIVLNPLGGNVGIGTTSPGARLDVRPTTATAYQGTVPYQTTTAAILSPVMAAASVDTYTSILQLVSVRQALVAGRYAHGYLGFSTVDNSNINGILDAGRISIKNDDGIGSFSATSMGFWTNTGGSASNPATERVRIASDGNVGIGNTSPSALLNIRASAPTGTGTVTTGTNLLIDSNTNNYITFRNTADNGTYAGLVFLDNNIGGYITFGNAGAAVGSDSMIYGAYQDHIFQNGYVNETLYNRTETMRIKANGYVGINTNNPTARLQVVQGNSGGVAAILLSSDESTIQGPSANTQIRMGSNLVLNASGIIPIGTNGSEKMRIQSDGNVGIGTTSPLYKLHVVGNSYVNAGTLLIDSGNSISWGNSTQYIFGNNGVGLTFVAGNVTRMFIANDGNVGIGTTAPVAKLHTVTTTAGSTVIRADGTSGTLFSVVDDLSDSLMSVNNSAGLPVLEVFADDRIVGGQYGVNDFVVINNKVGIGTNNPLGKLHVSGSNATSIIDGLSIGRGPGNIITNTIVGNGALLSNTTGVSNVAVGYRALNANTSGDRNTAVGRDALYINTSGYANNAFGRESLRSNTIGAGNSAFGDRALYSNTIGNNNSAFGAGSLYLNTTGTFNVAFGTYALRNNTIGISNSAFGYYALRGNSTGRFNTAVGRDALRNNSSGENNTAVGINALTNNTFGTYNTAVGGASLSSNTTGNRNSAFGTSALFSNTFGSGSAAFGHFALRNNTTGNYNVAMGALALRANTTGVGNSAFGVRALSTNPGFDGSFSSAFGYKALRYTFFGNKLSAFGAYALENNGTGVQNCAFGYKSLQANGGSRNNAFGYKSLVINTIGSNNNAFGYLSLASNTIGNNNNAFGRSALSANTTGNTNDAFGNYALRFNTTGQKNVAMGYQSLYTNTIGIRNNAFGYKALYSNSIGNANTAFGYLSLQNNNTSANTAFGSYALQANTTGWANVACGHRALTSNTTGSRNNAFGFYALTSNNSGYFNSAFGERSLRLTTSGAKNSAFGFYAIADNVVGVGNQAFGYRALKFNTTSYNHAFGNQALFNNTIGNANSAFGNYSLYTNTTGANNTAFGYRTLYSNSTGKNNSAFGYKAGEAVTTGTNLTIIGASAAASSATATNEITLGNSSVATLRCQVTTITALSDFRDKTDINDIQLGLSFVEKLRPVTFKWDRREWYTDGNRDGSKKDSVIQAGFIAQELKALQEEEGVEFLKLVYESNPDKLEATPGNLMIPLIKAVQELSAKVKTLEAKVQILESK